MQLSNKQKEFWNNASHRWNIKCGAVRSGKTYLDYFMIPRRIRERVGKEGLMLLLGNTQGTLERNILNPMRSIFTPSLVSHISSNNTIKLCGEEVYVLGADKVNQVSKIQGAGFKYVYGDEITTWNANVFNMLKSRIDKQYSCFDGTCNPDNPQHWFKQFLDSDADIYNQHYNIEDNPFNDPVYVENLKKEYAGTIFYDRYILGLWIPASGLIYPNFKEDKHIIDFTLPEGKDRGLYYISIDYGTANPFAAGLWRIGEGKDVMIKEYFFDSRKENRQKTDDEYYDEIDALAGKRQIQFVVVDPSAASFIELIRRKGKYSVRQADNTVIDGIRETATALNSGRLLFHGSCKNTIREFNAYTWDKNSLIDKPLKENDHCMDMIRYLVKTVHTREFR